MERFLTRHQGRIIGVLAGFDRLVFRGILPSIIHTKGMAMYLSSQGVLLKYFAPFAEQISSQIKQHARGLAQRFGRPFLYLSSSGTSKEDVARNIIKKHNFKQGLVCVLSCVEPCKSYTVCPNRKTKQLELIKLERKCLHLYFYYLDREFGLMHLRLQTWFPFTIQVCLNGREWLARQMDRAAIGYQQRDNCFTSIDDVSAAQKLLDKLAKRNWAPFLNTLAKRHNPWKNHGYYWTLWESEYATDLMFRDADTLASVYPSLTHHAIEHFDSPRILRFLGRRTNIRFNGEVKSEWAKRPEGVRIKHWVEENSIKMYDKYRSVLRIETTINNPKRFRVLRKSTGKGKCKIKWYYMRKGIADIPRRVEVSCAANKRYLEALSVVGDSQPSHLLLDPVSKRRVLNARSYRPLHPVSPNEAQIFKTLLRGEFNIQGFRSKDLRDHVEKISSNDPSSRRKSSARTSRLLRLLRAHGLIHKVPRTRYYRISHKGHQIMTTALRLREANTYLIAA